MSFVAFARAVRTQLKWAIVMIAVAAIVAPQRGRAQITVDTSTPVNPAGDHCSLQEAIYATEFGSNIALDQTDPDDTYNTGCLDSSAAWNVIDLPGGTLSFTTFWGGDAHNPFGATATPIIFKAITIRGHGTILQPGAGAGNFRLFAIGQASISPTSGVLKTGTYSGTGNLTLQDVYVNGFQIKGGDGSCGGGGGMGAGGAIYVGKVGIGTPVLTVENSTFASNQATGGNGAIYPHDQCLGPNQKGYFGGGGGGGLYGNGGNSGLGGGGGGGGGSLGNGGAGFDGAGGGGGGTALDGTIAFAEPNVINFWRGGFGGYLCGGDGGDFNADTVVTGTGHSAWCAGGGGGGAGLVSTGGSGSYGGGGGGGGGGDNASVGSAGSGGFGGGGGGASGGDDQHMATAGDGGFGGGGGGEVFSYATNGQGGAFAGSGGNIAGFTFGGSGAGLGGAIFNDGGVVVVRNSTLYGNSAHGGTTPASSYPAPPQTVGLDAGAAVFSRNGSLTVGNATISGNTTSATATGGGIVVISDGAVASFKLDNTILANNGTKECYVVNSVGLKGAGNLIMANDPTHGCPGVVQTTNPQLGALTLNAPGDTPTMAIQFGSSAVDNGDDAALASDNITTDQRDALRPQGAHSDIGAYEAPPPQADLSITKGVSSGTAQPGDTVTYTLSVSNAGPNDANSVTVTDTLPSQLTFVSCTANAGGTCTFNGATVAVTYATLATSASSTVTVTSTVNSGVTDGLTVGNSASVSASSPTDPDTSNNSSTVYFTIHNKADLAVTKSVSTTSPYSPNVEVGDLLTYTVTLTNKGPYDAKSVMLSDSAPAGVTFTGCTASVGTCVWSTTSASLSLSSFTNASVATLTIQATLNFGVTDGSAVTNTASVASPTNDPDPTNNAGSASFTVLNKSDLFLTQTVGKLVNQQLTYTVSVKNLGPYQAKQLLLNDAMPSGTKFVSVAAGPWTCTALPVNSTGTLSCTVSTLNLNATDSLSFTVKVTTTGKNINNTAAVSAATFDPNVANNTATLVTKSGAGK